MDDGDQVAEVHHQTGCGHYGYHQVLAIYPATSRTGSVIIIEGADPERAAIETGPIHTCKVLCETCGHISLMPMTFPSAASE